MTHRAVLSGDPRSNLVRIDNALDKMPELLESVKVQLENLYHQQDAAQTQVGKPFPQEEELRQKTARLVELDSLLNMDNRMPVERVAEADTAKRERPSVLAKLKAPCVHGATEQKKSYKLEER